MATKTAKKAKAKTRNLSVYKDDYDFFTEVADQNDRSRARMFRYAMSQIREGNPVPFVANGEASAK